MENILFVALLVLAGFNSFAQNELSNNSIWNKLHETDEVLFESNLVRCYDFQEGVDHKKQLLRVTNKTDKTLTVSWLNALFYDGTCSTCEQLSEYTNTLTIQPGITISGDCQSELRFLSIFSSDNKNLIKSKLTDLKIYQLVITINPKN